jgi:hypothetical protein
VSALFLAYPGETMRVTQPRINRQLAILVNPDAYGLGMAAYRALEEMYRQSKRLFGRELLEKHVPRLSLLMRSFV